MPRFPVYQRQQGLSGGPTASYAGDAIAAPARALQGLGNSIADAGANIGAAIAKTRESQDDVWFSKARAETAVDMIGQEQEAKKSATDGAQNYTPTIRNSFAEYRKQKVAGAPSKRAAEMYEMWANSFDADLTARSSRFQAESELAKRTSDFADAMNAHAQAIYADPSQFDVVYKRAMDDFEGAKQWMTPEQEAIAREKVEHDLKLSRAKSLVEFAPEDFVAEVGMEEMSSLSGGPAVNAVVDRIIGVESNGNANAKNPRSTASGLGQFTNSTWVATVRKHRPDIKGSNDDLIALKTDPKLGREMTARHTEDNAKALAAAGHTVNPANLYLAHFAGIGGAKKVLSADPADSVASILGNDVVRANPFLSGKDVQWLKDWTAKKMGGKVAPSNFSNDPRYAGLSVDEIRSLSTQAEQTLNQRATDYRNQVKGALELGIETGQVISTDQILGADLSDGDKATLLSKFRSRNEDEGIVTQTLAALADRSLNVSPYDSKAIKAIDTIAERGSKGEAADNIIALSEDIVSQSGIVPKIYLNRLRQGLESQDVATVATAAKYASRINQIDPNALGRREGGAEVEKAATAFSHFTNNVGLSPEQAGQRLIDMRDPEKARARASLMEAKPTKDWITKQANESKIRDIFDPGFFGFDPKLGTNPAQAAAMVGEYKSILEESLWDAAGDQDLAKTFAAQRFSRRYGTSTFMLDDANAITRLPPEKTYPVGADGTHEYIRDQVEEALKGEGVEAEKVYLQSDDITNDDFIRGRPARYRVYYEKDGKIEQFPLPFYAVPEAESGIPNSRIEELRKQRDQNIEGDAVLQDMYKRSLAPDTQLSPLGPQ